MTDTKWRTEMATLNAVNLQFLRTLAQDDVEALRAISGLSTDDCERIKNMSLEDIYNISRVPVLLCRPTFDNDLLRKLLAETKTDGGPVGVSGIAALVRNAGSKND